VADDALRKNKDAAVGISAVASAEEKMLQSLEGFLAAQPKDLARYEFALKTAIDTTRDSMDASNEDLKDRGRAIAEREADDKKKREASMSTEDKEQRAEAERKTGEADRKAKKAPTLKRKGEK
jgi:hypothetical protein